MIVVSGKVEDISIQFTPTISYTNLCQRLPGK